LKKITKILFTIPNFDTAGSGKALLNLAMGLDKNKYEVHIACLHNRGNYFNVVKESGIQVHVFNYLSPARPLMTLLKKTWQVSRILKKISPDLIHSFNYSDDYTEALSARLAGIPWVFTKKNMSWGGASKHAWKLRSYLAKGIIVQNTHMIAQFYPNRKNVQLIARGVNVNLFLGGTPDQAIREKMETPLESRLIICVANLIPVKGVEILLQAFEALASEYPEWILWIVGDYSGDYGREKIRWVKEHKLEQRIKFSGKQENVKNYLNIAEIFVLPTLGKGEGSPVAMLEAMANGKVVIGSEVPGIKDQLKDYPDNLFKPGNWQSLSNKLKLFMAATSKMNFLIGNLFMEHVKNKFSIENEIFKHDAFYQKILGDKQ
jgi:glycosyltransferase involved in cell wall biosynthesis